MNQSYKLQYPIVCPLCGEDENDHDDEQCQEIYDA